MNNDIIYSTTYRSINPAGSFYGSVLCYYAIGSDDFIKIFLNRKILDDNTINIYCTPCITSHGIISQAYRYRSYAFLKILLYFIKFFI